MHLKSINISFIFHDKILYLTAGQHLDLPEEVVVRVRQSVEVSLRKRLTSLLLNWQYAHKRIKEQSLQGFIRNISVYVSANKYY